ncbi:ACT domain-containing protein, partial [Wenyingzhuangia sp. 1_MG-2023]|nr:ACT domain-containing protein [Wenyingzhuangia sp. 1_MG-2023]
AGAGPTASAVVADIIDLARTLEADASVRVNHLAYNEIEDEQVLPMEEVVTSYYLRLQVQDKTGVLASVATILSERGINIEAIIQKEPK